MKCGRRSCPIQTQDGRFYCSRSCAQLDVDDDSPDTDSSEEQDESGLQVPGDPSRESLLSENETESAETPPTRKDSESRNETGSGTGNTPNDSAPSCATAGSSGRNPSENARTIEEQKMRTSFLTSDVSAEELGKVDPGTASIDRDNWISSDLRESETTPRMASPALSPALNAGILDSVKLIDSSANELHRHLKSYEKRSMNKEEIQSVSNIAKTITGMIRLKLDIAREFRKR